MLRLLRIATSSWPKTVTIHGRSLLARSRPDQQTCLRLQAWQDQCQATAARSIQNSRQYIALVVQERLSLQGDNKFCQQNGINSGWSGVWTSPACEPTTHANQTHVWTIDSDPEKRRCRATVSSMLTSAVTQNFSRLPNNTHSNTNASDLPRTWVQLPVLASSTTPWSTPWRGAE